MKYEDIDETLLDNRIKELNKKGFTCSSIERALGLEQGTMIKWQEDNINPEEEALLNIISKFPWMIYIADNKYKGKVKIELEYEFGDIK